jgi:hypothetical protein
MYCCILDRLRNEGPAHASAAPMDLRVEALGAMLRTWRPCGMHGAYFVLYVCIGTAVWCRQCAHRQCAEGFLSGKFSTVSV